VLRVRGAGRRIESRWIWRRLTFRLEGGERLGLSGPSGAGKTLLLRALAALDPLDEGEIEFDGRGPEAWGLPEYRALVTYLPQEATLAEGTVRTNLEAPFSFRAHEGKDLDLGKAEELLACMGRSSTFLQKEVRDLSGGERQIAALVRVLLLGPRILLLDEPAASMDEELASRAETAVLDWIQGAGEARALIWTSHRPDQLDRVSERRLEL